ncbi:hypothetical protein KH172YL63_21640 [Bacillus sp. KH172YL63]|nr:hypothetical protein KH172YL63_21640 [Bacillus sp. KH172YL63]
MKRRFSIKKAEWSVERENHYKQYCFNIVFNFGDKMKTNDRTVYIIKNEEEIELEKPLNPKTFWYETWLKLKVFYQLD